MYVHTYVYTHECYGIPDFGSFDQEIHQLIATALRCKVNPNIVLFVSIC